MSSILTAVNDRLAQLETEEQKALNDANEINKLANDELERVLASSSTIKANGNISHESKDRHILLEALRKQKIAEREVRRREADIRFLKEENSHLRATSLKQNEVNDRLKNLSRELHKQVAIAKEQTLSEREANQERLEKSSAEFNERINEVKSMIEKHSEMGEMHRNLENTVTAMQKQAKMRDDYIDALEKSKELEVNLERQKSEIVAKELATAKQLIEELTERLRNIEDSKDFSNYVEETQKIMNTYKKQLEKLSSTIEQVQHENLALRTLQADETRKHAEVEKKHLSLLRSVDARRQEASTKVEKLTTLSRALQKERGELSKRLQQYESSSGDVNVADSDAAALETVELTNKEAKYTIDEVEETSIEVSTIDQECSDPEAKMASPRPTVD